MKNKVVSGIMLTLLLLGMLTFAFNIQPIKTEPTTITVPDDYPTIQEAIDHAYDGDTIFVRAETYLECVIIDKSVNLQGENKETTIIDGSGVDNVIMIAAYGVVVQGFTITNSKQVWPHAGIKLVSVSDCDITNNILLNNEVGIYLENAEKNDVDGNTIQNNAYGIVLEANSNSNILSNNDIFSITFDGIILDRSNFNTLLRNRIHEAPISSNNAILLSVSSWNLVVDNDISNNFDGISVEHSWPIEEHSINNILYHNNLIGNVHNTWDETGPNTWYNSTLNEGNFYSDYTGVDSDGDGIGDTPYIIEGPAGALDLYPLMNPWTPNYELTVSSLPVTGIPFTIDGELHYTPYVEMLPEGPYLLEMPEIHDGYTWSHWLEDGDTSRIKTITLPGTTWTGVYEPEIPPVPEFPLGFAMQIALLPIILYIWWKKHRTLQ